MHAIAARISNAKYPGLASQLRRATPAVPSQIAEGCAHSSRREFARFLQIALASSAEVGHHLDFARDVNALTADTQLELSGINQEVRQKLAKLLRVVRDELSEAETDEPGVTTDAMRARKRAIRTRNSRAPRQITERESRQRDNSPRDD